MKKIFIPLILVIWCSTISAQEFSTKIYFKDKIGHKDSITIGYSSIATDSLNASLEEVNLLESDIDINFFAGISDVKVYQQNEYQKAHYRSKVKYVNSEKPDYQRYLCLDVICKNFPLTLYWNKDEFLPSERSKSFLICSPPGGWFDVSEQPNWLVSTDSIVYTKEYIIENVGFFYIDSIQSKPIEILKLYVDFAGSYFNLSIHEIQNNIDFKYNNPCKNSLDLEFKQVQSSLIQIFSLNGTLIYNKYLSGCKESIDLSDFESGMFILKVITKDKSMICKILKYI